MNENIISTISKQSALANLFQLTKLIDEGMATKKLEVEEPIKVPVGPEQELKLNPSRKNSTI